MPNSHLLEYLTPRLDAFLSDLATLSSLDCGTYDKEGVDTVGRIMHARLEALGFVLEEHDGGTLGNSLVAHWRGQGRARVLLLSHLDTVYPRGWTAEHPCHREGSIMRGPGTADMKAGLLAGLYALDALHSAHFDRFAEITFLLNSDEEIGSPSSKRLIEEQAIGRDAVLVLEAGRENGDIVSSRKGLAHFDLTVTGRAAHAGVEPQKGRSAILELAHQIVALQALNGTITDATINIGVIGGGTRPNVVPAEAQAVIDVRAFEPERLNALIAAMHERIGHTTVPDTLVELHGSITHLPMPKTAATARLVQWCQEAAADAGFQVDDAATGGGSDGNTTGAMGIPTLDGLGPVGGLDHSPQEYVDIDSILPRTAMLGGLIERICASV